MSIHRWSFAIAVVPVVALASGCASTASSPTTTLQPMGVVAGVASPCEGPYMPPAKLAAIPVRVQLLKNSRVVAEQSVTGSHTFHFAAPSGSYEVRSNQSATAPATVELADGQRKVVNLYSACM